MEFKEAFASVAKFITTRCILTIEVVMAWEIHQMDVKSMCFSNEVLRMEIFMDQRGDSSKRRRNILCANLRKFRTCSSNH